MTQEILENEEIKIFSYYNGERKVYKIVLNGAMIEVSHRSDDIKRAMK